MFGQEIPWQNKTQYFGVFIDKKLSFIPHTDYIVAKTNGIQGVLAPLISKRGKMSIKNKLLLYRTIIRPTISYASAA